MGQICIQVPPLRSDHTIGLEVTIDGTKRIMTYRVESFDWSTAATPQERIERLRTFIRSYERDWELVQIGQPDGTLVPVMFRRRSGAEASA